jgi:hypothetical protein
MPIETELDPNRGIRLHRVTGVLVPEELLETLQDLYGRADFNPDMSVLWDIREADVSSFTRDDVVRLRDLVKDHWGVGGSSRAALVVSREIDYGLARMYGLLLDKYTSSDLKVFRDMNEALDWASAR